MVITVLGFVFLVIFWGLRVQLYKYDAASPKNSFGSNMQPYFVFN